LKNVALSYSIPKTWQKAAHLQNARIYFRAQNLFTLTAAHFVGFDPETGSAGLPPLRMLTFGIQATL
jgi:hypothetical protein